MALKSSKANSPLVPNELDSAVLTHYVVTKNKVYKDKAYEIAENNPSEFHEPEALYQAVQKSLFDVTDIPFPGPPKGKEKFTFIDLFAGIGGFRLALQNLGGFVYIAQSMTNSLKKHISPTLVKHHSVILLKTKLKLLYRRNSIFFAVAFLASRFL
nr:DNA cytosine methyltransferase [Mucilaginibacter humi]